MIMETESYSPGVLSRLISVADLPAHGREVLIKPSVLELTEIAKYCELVAISYFDATFLASRSTEARIIVKGNLQARVVQNCSITLNAFDELVHVEISQIYALRNALAKEQVEIVVSEPDPPEPTITGVIDFGALALEYFILNLDPHPRSPNASFEMETCEVSTETLESETSKPFAALAALKNSQSG